MGCLRQSDGSRTATDWKWTVEVEDQVFGVHAAPIIAVYGVNDMAPWGHMYVNPGLTEP